MQPPQPSAWYRDLEEDLLSGVAIAFPIRSLDPSLSTRLIAPTRAEVGQWLVQAGELDLTDATSQRGVLFLEQLSRSADAERDGAITKLSEPVQSGDVDSVSVGKRHACANLYLRHQR